MQAHDAAYRFVGLLRRSHAHLNQHCEPARLVGVQSIFCRSGRLVLLLAWAPQGLCVIILPDRPVNLVESRQSFEKSWPDVL